jgi:2-C-methyl-D-erythritol 4-phosphate cytidylyltransferase
VIPGAPYIGAVPDLLPELPPAVGMVLEAGRGSLPYGLIHGEPLVRCAVIALEEAGIEPLDPDTDWAEVVDHEAPLVLHDALCPLVPPDFLVSCVVRAVATDRVVVGYRPVTDTVKRVGDGILGETIDRTGLRALAAPVVLPARVVAALDRPPGTDMAALVARLAPEGVEWVEAPAEGRRVGDEGDVRLLEALTAPA